jgi:hypothetical protein
MKLGFRSTQCERHKVHFSPVTHYEEKNRRHDSCNDQTSVIARLVLIGSEKRRNGASDSA